MPVQNVFEVRLGPSFSTGSRSNLAELRCIYTSKATRNRRQPRMARTDRGKAYRFADSCSGRTAHGRSSRPQLRSTKLHKCRELQASLHYASKSPRGVVPAA
jgi:hypothetical protein